MLHNCWSKIEVMSSHGNQTLYALTEETKSELQSTLFWLTRFASIFHQVAGIDPTTVEKIVQGKMIIRRMIEMNHHRPVQMKELPNG